jgi:hypothetical protein
MSDKRLTTDSPDIAEIERPEIAFSIETEEESQVIVHCSYTSAGSGDLIRIWPTTFLIPQNSSFKSQLIHAENITLFPFWTEIPLGKTHTFTLVFQGLPRDCILFDMVEEIGQPGAFVVKNIRRNKTDVYHVEIPNSAL